MKKKVDKTDSKSNKTPINVSEPKIADENVKNPISHPDALDLFARKKNYGVVIMTKEASERGDENKKSNVNPIISTRYSNCIKKIREDQ